MFKPINIFLVFCIIASRLLPHPPNFTPVIAVFMFSTMINLVPFLLAYMFTDMLIGFHPYMLWVYSSLLLVGLMRFNPLASSIAFFLITNFGVWVSGAYGLNLQGFLTTYTLAIPFFANTLISTVIFYYLIKRSIELSSKIYNYSFSH